jgi:hypothetical protein
MTIDNYDTVFDGRGRRERVKNRTVPIFFSLPERKNVGVRGIVRKSPSPQSPPAKGGAYLIASSVNGAGWMGLARLKLGY